MGCGSCGGNKNFVPSFAKNNQGTATPPIKSGGVVNNLIQAGATQKNKFQWFKDGISGLWKCVGETQIHTDEQIAANRAVCQDCRHSTKKNSELYPTSQCMAPDPAKNGETCGCFITCKSMVDKCPLGKWVDITISAIPNPS